MPLEPRCRQGLSKSQWFGLKPKNPRMVLCHPRIFLLFYLFYEYPCPEKYLTFVKMDDSIEEQNNLPLLFGWRLTDLVAGIPTDMPSSDTRLGSESVSLVIRTTTLNLPKVILARLLFQRGLMHQASARLESVSQETRGIESDRIQSLVMGLIWNPFFFVRFGREKAAL